jgi:hypothetical protein
MANTLLASFIKKPKDTYFQGEDAGEEVLYVLRRSFITNAPWILFSAFLLTAPTLMGILFIYLNLEVTGFITPGFAVSLNLFWYLFTLGFIFERYLNWFFNVYIITSKRVVDMDFYHLLAKRISSADLKSIEDITYHVEGFFPVIFNFGDIFIQTAGKKREFEFEQVAKPTRVKKILTDLVREAKYNA